MKSEINPLDILGIKREHLIALHEAYTHTNKRTSKKRAGRLYDLFQILKAFDDRRNELQWEDENITQKSNEVPASILELQEQLKYIASLADEKNKKQNH